MIRRIIKYIMSSGIAAAVDFVIFAAVTHFGGSVALATACGRAISSVLNFTLNRNAVFRSDGKVAVQFVKYILLVCLSGTASALLISFLKSHLPLNVVVIKACVESLLFVVNYIIQRLFIFRSSRPEREKDGAE